MMIGSLSPVLFAGRTAIPLDRRWLLFVLVASIGVVSAILLEAEIFVPIALIAALLAGLTFRMPVIWLIAIVLFHLDILRRTEEISVGEILFAVVGFGYTVLWFGRQALAGSKFIWHRSDALWFGFFTVCLLSAIPAFVYQVDPVRWVRWVVYFLPYFLLFPAREILSERRTMPWIGGAFLLLAAAYAAQNILQYKTAASSAVFAWQLLSGRQSANEPLFMVSILLSLAVVLTARRVIVRWIFLGLMIFFSVALVLTFSRGYWVGTILAVGVFGLLLSWKSRIRFVALIGLTVIGAAFFFTVIFQDLGSSVFRTIVDRVSTRSLNVALDPSLRARVLETQELFERLAENPLTGYGLGKNLTFFNPLTGAMFSNDYGHNAYLFLWFSVGIGGLILYLWFYATRLIEAIRLARYHPSPFGQAIFAAMASIMVAMLAISMTSPQFYTRGSVLILMLMWSAMDAERSHALST